MNRSNVRSTIGTILLLLLLVVFWSWIQLYVEDYQGWRKDQTASLLESFPEEGERLRSPLPKIDVDDRSKKP